MKNLNKLFILLTITLGACQAPAGSGQPASVAPEVSRTTQNDPADNQPAPQGQSNPVQLTYYTVSRTESPVNGWQFKTVTMAGSCATYLTVTYCWDDGIKTLDWTANQFHYGPFNYSYFGIDDSAGPCHGGCVGDYLSVPRGIGVGLGGNIPHQDVLSIFNFGTPNTVTCSETDGVLDCGSFSIDSTVGAI